MERDPSRPSLKTGSATDQRGAAEGLTGDARRLRALIDANFDAYYDWHVSAGYHEWSAQMDALLELPQGASFPRQLDAWVERLDPDEADGVVARLMSSIEHAEPYIDEYRLRTDSGKYRLVSDRGIVLLDEDGRVTDLVGVIRDITSERQAQISLEESEALYRTLFEAGIDPALRTDRDGLLQDANDAALSFLGVTKESMGRANITDFFGDAARGVLDHFKVLPQPALEPESLEATTALGKPKTLRMSVVPCRYQSSMTYFWLGTDVSDLLSLTSALTESQASLQEQTRALEERAIALRVFLEQGRQERGELAESLRSNLDSLIVPWLDRLSRALAGHPEAAYVEAIRETLRDVAGGLYDERGVNAHPLPAMTVREQEVLQLVRQGQTTDQIAAALHLSSSAVSFHRKNIRRKLGLHGKAQRLNSYVARR